MTQNQYKVWLDFCRHCFPNCAGCPCGKRHCFKYYIMDAVFDFPNRNYESLTLAEKQAVQRKKIFKL